MSVGREVIADALGIAPEEVRCGNCKAAERWINDAYICSLWRVRCSVGANEFCSFFAKKDDET